MLEDGCWKLEGKNLKLKNINQKIKFKNSQS